MSETDNSTIKPVAYRCRHHWGFWKYLTPEEYETLGFSVEAEPLYTAITPVPTVPAGVRGALRRIAYGGWSNFSVDGEGAHIAGQIITEMRQIAHQALARLDAAAAPAAVPVSTMSRDDIAQIARNNLANAHAALGMIREAVEEFGPIASLEGPDAVLLRGPEPTDEAEAIIEALGRVRSYLIELREPTPAPAATQEVGDD